MKPLIFSLLVMGYLQGCTGDAGTSFFLSTVVKPDPAQCTYSATGDVLIEASGLFDPSFVEPYEIVAAGANLLENSKADTVIVAGGGPPVRAETNTLTVRSFDVCYYVRTEDPEYIKHLKKINGDKIEENDCTSDKLKNFASLLPAHYESVPAQGVIPPSEDKTSPEGVAIFGEIYSPQTLNILFGDAFNPTRIANLPDKETDKTGNTRNSSYFPTTTGDRDINWGEWPEIRSHLNGVLETIIDIRAVAGTQTGTVIKSNWIQFPIKLQVKSRAAKICGDKKSTLTNCPVEACEVKVEAEEETTITYNPCDCDEQGNNCACVGGPGNTECAKDERWIGELPDFADACLPQQNREAGECKPVACPAIGGEEEEEE